MPTSIWGQSPWGDPLWGAPGGESLTGTPLPPIILAKELAEGFQPLLLAEFTFLDGSVLRASSENLDSAEGGPPWQGYDWLPRLKAQELAPISAVSNNGIVQSPNVTLTLTDADKFVLNTYEWTNGRGFKGARLKLYFIFADLSTGSFSLDYRVLFVGTCNPPSFDAGTISIKADNLLNMTRKNLPQTRVQNSCNWVFPTTHAQRRDGAINDQGIYWHCGYSPDMGAGDGALAQANARGNLDPGTGQPYTSCSLTYSDCVARLGNAALPTSAPPGGLVQIEVDQQNRPTARHSGIFYKPPYNWRGVEYISGVKTQGINTNNDAKFNDYYPIIYGTSFENPIVMNMGGDPNSTRFEVALCVGQLTTDRTNPYPIQAVLVNGAVIPFYTQTTDLLLRWYWDTTGDRTGATMKGPIFNGTGNCYGGIATLLIIVPISLQDSSSTPNVRVLTGGPPIRVFTANSPTSFLRQVSPDPVWILADILLQTGWKLSDLNLDTFLAEANYANASISYIGLDGAAHSHQRYRAGMAYRDPRTVHECVTNFLASWRGMLRASTINGNLEILIRKTLADQQPNPIPSSNNQNPVASFTSTGAIANGYLAYDFNETNIKWVNGAPSLRFQQRPYGDTPNRIQATFQDEDAGYVNDTLSLIDTDDVARIQQVVKSNLTAEGLINYDQAFRILESMEAEQFRGNPRTPVNGMTFDTGGTLEATFTSTFKTVDLRCGDIVKLAFGDYALSELFRVQSIKPAADYEEAEVIATLHKDEWYADVYGQNAVPSSGKPPATPGIGTIGASVVRPPFAPLPGQIAPSAADALQSPTNLNFGMSLAFPVTSGATAAVATVSGTMPVNLLSGIAQTPFTPLVVPSTFTGTVPVGTYWIAVSALDLYGLESAASTSLPSATLTAPGNLNITNIVWGTGTVTWKAFAGTNPNHLSLQASGTGRPASIVISSFNTATEGPPDAQFQSLEIDVSREAHPGVWVAPVTTLTSTTIQIAGAGWTVDQWAGGILSILGKATGTTLPIGNFLVASNTVDTLTLGPNAAGNTPDLNMLGLQAGDLVTMRARGVIATDTTIGDPSYVNSLPQLAAPLAIANVAEVTPLVIATASPHGFVMPAPFRGIQPPGPRVLITGAGTDANGQWTITVIDPFQFSLDGSSASAYDYPGGGEVQALSFGFIPAAEIGRMVRIIAGTAAGQTRNIVANSETTVTVGSAWDLNPDATSIWIITDAMASVVQSSGPLHNASPSTPFSLPVNLGDIELGTVFVQTFAVGGNGLKSLVNDSPFREIYIPEAPLFSARGVFYEDGRYWDEPAYVHTSEGQAPFSAVESDPYIVPCSFVGKPGAGATVLLHTFTQPVVFQANWAGAKGSFDPVNGALPTTAASYTLKKLSGVTLSDVGTVVISSLGAYTFATTGGAIQTFGVDDLLIGIAPNPQDATLAGAAWSLPGTR